jgi:hypothetical protein
MNSVFENSGKIVAAISVALLALSVIYEWGYFHVIGSEFQKFESSSDYLSNAIGWLPYLILLFVGWGVWIAYQFVAPVDRKKDPDAPDVFNVSLALAAGILLFLGLDGLLWAQDWPMFVADLFIALWAVLAWVCLKRFRRTVDTVSRSTRAILLIAPVAIAFAYTVGGRDGYRDQSTPTELYVVETSKEKLKMGLLRSFDKGILVRNPVENTNQFIRWEEVRSIRHDSAPKGSRNLCSLYIWSWLAWLCH